MSTAYRIHTSTHYVKPQPAELPKNYDALVKWRYSPREGQDARDKLAQGELDVLETCRQELGWQTITSLATKWYPLYPSRKAWARALSHCRQFVGSGKLRTRTLNLKYLLRAVITHFQEQLHLIYDRIRIPSLLPTNKEYKEYSNTSSGMPSDALPVDRKAPLYLAHPGG